MCSLAGLAFVLGRTGLHVEGMRYSDLRGEGGVSVTFDCFPISRPTDFERLATPYGGSGRKITSSQLTLPT